MGSSMLFVLGCWLGCIAGFFLAGLTFASKREDGSEAYPLVHGTRNSRSDQRLPELHGSNLSGSTPLQTSDLATTTLLERSEPGGVLC